MSKSHFTVKLKPLRKKVFFGYGISARRKNLFAVKTIKLGRKPYIVLNGGEQKKVSDCILAELKKQKNI